jgi:hypothetical protein
VLTAVVNSIKTSADGLALQVTKPARQAGLVVEDADGNWTQLADVYAYGFDDLLLVIDQSVSMRHRAELVSSAAGDTGSIHVGYPASVTEAGNGYQVQLPGCKAAGFTKGDRAPVHTAPGLLVIHDGTQRRLANDLTTQRHAQATT